MAVIKAKVEKIVPFFLGLMERDSVLPYAITRVGQDFFDGALNDTVTLRSSKLAAVGRDYEWRTRTAPIVMDDITEASTGIAVKLDTHCYSGTLLTDEHMTLDQIDFNNEVVAPQVEAVTARMEAKVVAALAAAPFASTLTLGDTADPHLVAIEANRLLNTFKVAPTQGRVLVIGDNIAAHFLASDRLSRYESTGQNGTPALRDHIIGKLGPNPVVTSNGIDPNAGYLIHSSALVLGNVAPVVPRGVTTGRSGVSANGFACRWIADYDPAYLRDRSIVSSFVGITSVNDERDANGNVLSAAANAGAGPRNVRGVKLTFTGTPSVL